MSHLASWFRTWGQEVPTVHAHPTRSSLPEALPAIGACGLVALAAAPAAGLLSVRPAAAAEIAALYADGALALWLAAASLAFLVSLRLARSQLPAPSAFALSGAVWLLFWGLLAHWPALALSRTAVEYSRELLAGALAAAATAPLTARWYVRRRLPWLPKRAAASPWIVPGLILFCGIGALWLMDYTAHGPARYRMHMEGQAHYALRQAVDAAVLFMLVSLLTPFATPMLRGLMRVMSWFESTSRGRMLLAGAGCAWAALLAVTYRTASAHIVGELLRLPYLLVFAWWCYRWIDSSMSFARLALQTAAAWAIFFAACLLVRETGQLLLCTVVTAVTLGGLRAHVALVRHAWRGPLAAVLAACAVGLIGASVFMLGAALPHVAARILALEQPFTAGVDFLALNKWFIAEAGWTGFGLGRVPWCGYAGSLAGTCNGAAGLPQQLPMDYVFVGLAGVWGLAGALAITVALILWLAAMAGDGGRAALPAMSIRRLRDWIVSIWCLAMLVQVFLTAMGSLGAFPLTGLPLPFLSVGRLGIFTSAFVLAWAATELEELT
jgi:cell division protein FtsW (lipid II flippase)